MPLPTHRSAGLLSLGFMCATLLLSGPASALRPQTPAQADGSLVPAFEQPSAQDCQRPPTTRELPGRVAVATAKERGGRLRERLHAPAPAPATESLLLKKEAPMSLSVAPAPQGIPRERPLEVTAGMVDDNADFTEYLAFRARTPVPHHTHDIRERHLLIVRDATGRTVPDAQVLLRAPNQRSLQARTDSAGRVWLHPRALDSEAAVYEVVVRHGRQVSQGLLRPGQKDALELKLQHAMTPQRARLDLVFLVDATGSMADEIQKLKRSLHSIATDAARLPSRPDLCFGLVAYRDTTDPFVVRSHDFTSDLGAFQKVLDQLQADGGGDMPEALGEALQDTVLRLSWRGDGTTRMVLLLADAPPQIGEDRPSYANAMQVALGKGIKIFSVGASGLDPQGEFILRQMAQYTGGRFVFLTYARAGDPASGPGRETVHDVGPYSVDSLDRLIGRLIREELAPLSAPRS